MIVCHLLEPVGTRDWRGEAAGTVEAVGPGVTTVRPGDRVGSVTVLGAYAEYALAPAEGLVPLPDRVSDANMAMPQPSERNGV